MGTKRDSVIHARRRALVAFALFAIGTLVGARMLSFEFHSLVVYVLGVSSMVLALAVFGPRRTRTLMMCLCVMLLACGWTMLRADPTQPDRLHIVVGEIDAKLSRVPIEVRGIVSQASRVVRRKNGLADPPMWPESTNRAELRVRSALVHESQTRMEWVDASGTLQLVLPIGLELRAGQRVELLGNYNPPGQRRNPGEPDWALSSAQQGHVGTLVIDNSTHVRQRVAGGMWDRVLGSFLSTRSDIRTRALESVGLADGVNADDASAMRSALLLGEREPVFDDVFVSFQRVGVAHVLAISGFHLALVVLMLVLGVRLIGEHPKLEALVVVLALLGVVLLIPMRPPIVRAAVIVGAMLLATRVGRRYDRMTILAWVGLGLLVWRPLDVASMGYQLSMGMTALLVTLNDRQRSTKLKKQQSVMALRDAPRGWLRRALGWVWDMLKMNLGCWAVSLPIVMYHAGVVGVLAPIVAVVLVPVVAVLMAIGYVQIIIGIVSPKLAQQTMWMIDGPSNLTLGLVSWVEGLTIAWVRVPSVSVWWTLAATFMIALIVTRCVSIKKPGVITAALIIVAWGSLQPVLHRPGVPLRAAMLDVGDGSCIVLQSGSDAIIWDCGSLDRRVGTMSARSLRAMGVTRVSDVIVTHDNLDHYNGLPDLAESIAIDRVWITHRLDVDGSPAWTRVRENLESQGIEFRIIRAGDQLQLNDATLSVIWPDPEAIEGFDDNDTSVVALVRVADDSPALLLTGDIEGPAMAHLRSRSGDLPELLNGGLIEIPHHGSARKEAFGFIDWLSPGVVLQSTGPSRLNDDRWDGQRPGRAWYTTADQGAVWIEFNLNGTIEHGWWYEK